MKKLIFCHLFGNLRCWLVAHWIPVALNDAQHLTWWIDKYAVTQPTLPVSWDVDLCYIHVVCIGFEGHLGRRDGVDCRRLTSSDTKSCQ